MTYLFHYIAAALALTLAVIALLRDRKASVHQVFAAGMVLLALDAALNGLSSQALLMENAAFWQIWRLRAAALVPGTWLIFSLIFVRPDRRLLPTGFKWLIAAVILLHLVLLLPLDGGLLSGAAKRLGHGWALELAALGYGFYVASLLSLILVLVVFEKSLRASKGRKRWQIKFLVLGIGGVMAARLVVASYTLVYWRLDPMFEIIASVALIATFPLIVIAMRRAGNLQLDLYFSQKTIFNSLTLIIVGLFFLALGLATTFLKGTLPFPLRSLIIFSALLGLLILLLSDRLRVRLKSFVSTRFHGGQHDYREIWLSFTNRTQAIVETRPLCDVVAKMISEIFDALSVSIWLLRDSQQSTVCMGSTGFSLSGIKIQNISPERLAAIEKQLKARDAIIDVEDPDSLKEHTFSQAYATFFEQARIRYLVPLEVGHEMLGVIAVGDLVGNRSLTLEDKNILLTIGKQAAANLKNIQMADQLRQGQELEAFQTVSAFFVHDLKNLASRLSMLFQNLPANFDNPEFREDALRLMAGSVAKINAICSRLSSMREKLEIKTEAVDLNQVVETTVEGIKPDLNDRLGIHLESLPALMLDPGQIRKVVTNLVLNALEAVGRNDGIHITTSRDNEWAELCVSDDGCGMSRAFMDQSLFKPFKTTKKQGSGIGLFQSKMIVEAHGGKIEVDSVEGEGSTFRVLLPLTGRAKEKGSR